jgi:hypothetical protein
VLLGLLAVTAGVRLWLIDHTEIIASDGIRYIEMARQWGQDPAGVIESYDYHVGYPLLIRGAHALLGGLLPAGLEAWHVAGQWVSLVFSLAAVAAMYLLAVQAVGRRTAWIAALLWAVGCKWSHLGADVLSDAPAVAFQLWALLVGTWMVRRLRRPGKPSCGLALALVAGLLAGAGYLIRPESLAVVGVLWILLAGLVWQKRRQWGRCAVAGAVMLAAALLAASPYMIAIGGFSKKKSLSEIVHAPAAVAAVRAVPAGLFADADYFVLRHLLNMLFEAMHPVPGVLAVLWLLSRLRPLVSKAPVPAVLEARLRPMGRWLIPACMAVYLPIACGLYMNVGYMSHRHVLVPAAVIAPLAGLGVVHLAGLGCWALARQGRRLRRGHLAVVIALVTAACMAGLHTLRPLHEGKAQYRLAGLWLRDHRQVPAGRLLTDSAWVLHYAQWPGTSLDGGLDAAILTTHAVDERFTHVALSLRTIRKADANLPARLLELGYQPLHSVRSADRPERRAAVIFSRAPAAATRPASH